MNTDFAKFHVPNPAGAAPALPESSKNSMVLDQLVNDFKVKVVTNSLPLSAFDEFVKDWKSKGGEANIKEINDWYKTYKK
jgi:putative aldouronate transport system substrate-binding protein